MKAVLARSFPLSVFCTLLPACSAEIPALFFISSPRAINLIREVVKATKFSNRLISSLIKQYWKRADDSSEKYALESFVVSCENVMIRITFLIKIPCIACIFVLVRINVPHGP